MKSLSTILFLALLSGSTTFAAEAAVASEAAEAAKTKGGKACGQSFFAQFHDFAHCVLMIVPEGFTHAEDPQHFRKCCPWSRRRKEE
ncbi:hypothetical protein CDD83_10398 [Cordyceps sp. RAO-2017]|nr:hypothetical protein CDD83_10398 [Cordyceps sp. RAO-2017]